MTELISSVWKTVPVRELYEGLYDGPHATPKPSDSGPVFLGIKNVTNDGRLDLSDIRHISEEDMAKWTKRVEPRTGDLVFTYEATLNRYAIIPDGFRGCLGRRMALIRPNTEKVDVRFLLYYFFSHEWRAVIKNNMLTGATVDRIPLTTFPEFPVNIPPLPTQERIAGVLSAYDELIENNQRRIRILEEMARSLYREWFVHFRYPGHEAVPLIDSPLGPIPQGWEEVTFSDIYDTASGGTPSRKVSEYYGGEHPWVKTKELKDGFILEVEENITDLGLKKSSAKLFPKNTVIIAMYGATIGRLGILSKSAATNQACAAILPKEPSFGRAFSFSFLRENKKEIIGLGQGAAQQNISQIVIKNFPALRPSTCLVESYSKIVEPMFDIICNLQQRNTKLRQSRDLLLPKLLSGDVSFERELYA